MADIARLAGVSVSSVSRALAGSALIPQALRDRINAIARDHGYVVNQAARSLRLQTTHTIGVVLPVGHEVRQAISDPFMLELVGALADEVMARGYDLLLSRVASPGPDWLNELTRSQRFDGLLVLGQSDQHAALDAAARDYPAMVVWGEFMRGQRYCSVGVNNAAAGRAATEHLLRTGCRNILFIGPSGVPEADARYEGYAETMKAAGLTPVAHEARFVGESAQSVVEGLLAGDQPFDALFCASDVIAAGALRALQAAGRRVPEEVSVIGFDNIAIAAGLGLTTVRQDRIAGASAMVETLFGRMAGQIAGPVRLPVELVLRGTTRPVSA